MLHEIEYINSDRAALKWAVGCVSAGYVRRIASFNVVQTAIIRWAAVIFVASWAVIALLSACLFYLNVSGQRTTTSVWNVLPAWSFWLDAIAGLFYIVGTCWLIRKKMASVWVLLAGTALNAIACAAQMSALLQEYGPALPAEQLHRTYVMYVLHVGVIAMLWYGFGRDARAIDSSRPNV